MDLEESEIEEQELEFEARFDYENDIDPNKLDLNGKRVKVPVSYYQLTSFPSLYVAQ